MHTSCATSSAACSAPGKRARRARQYRWTIRWTAPSSDSAARASPSTARAASRCRSGAASSVRTIARCGRRVTGRPPDPCGASALCASPGAAMGLPDQTPAETDGDRLGAVGRTDLAEESTGVGLDGVLGEEELLADLGVAPTAAHSGQHLHLAL